MLQLLLFGCFFSVIVLSTKFNTNVMLIEGKMKHPLMMGVIFNFNFIAFTPTLFLHLLVSWNVWCLHWGISCENCLFSWRGILVICIRDVTRWRMELFFFEWTKGKFSSVTYCSCWGCSYFLLIVGLADIWGVSDT